MKLIIFETEGTRGDAILERDSIPIIDSDLFILDEGLIFQKRGIRWTAVGDKDVTAFRIKVEGGLVGSGTGHSDFEIAGGVSSHAHLFHVVEPQFFRRHWGAIGTEVYKVTD